MPAAETLKCQLNAPGKGDKSIPYQTFLDRGKDFKELKFLPLPLTHLPTNIAVQDLVQNKAMWHKSCFLKFGQEKLEKVRKRNVTDTELEFSNSCGSKRICPPCHSLDKEKCVFCEESCGKLHHSTLEAAYVLLLKTLKTLHYLQKLREGTLLLWNPNII